MVANKEEETKRKKHARAQKKPRKRFGGEKFYLLLRLVLVLVPIGWIKIDRNRRKDHGIELISFDLLLLVSESFFSAGLFVPRSRRTARGASSCFAR